MPWRKEKGGGTCGPDQWAVIRETDEHTEGCHDTEADADSQLAAKYAQEADANEGDDMGGDPSPGTKKDRRLEENRAGADVETFVSETPWDGSASRFTDAEYRRAAAICEGDGPPKTSCHLPHHEPGGAVSRAGVHAAAAGRGVSRLEGVSSDGISRAKSHLRGHYTRDLDEDPPDSISAVAGIETFAEDGDGPCPEGQHKMPDGRCMDDVDQMASDGRWEGILAVEGKVTGDGREFSPGSLFWHNLPLTLTYQPPTHGGVPGAGVDIGRIDRVWRDGRLVRGGGVIDLDAKTEDGRQILKLVRDKTLRGLSVDVDSMQDADVEFVFPDEKKGDDDEGEIILMAAPEKMIFHKGRVRGAALLSMPAFIESELWLAADGDGPPVSGYDVADDHVLATVDEPWDSTVAEALLVEHLTLEVARAAGAWTNPEGVRSRDDVRFLHHRVADGVVGPANLTACSVGIGLLQRGQLSSTLRDPDRRAAYHHLAEHLRAADREPPPLLDAALVAALAAVDDWRPPRDWFVDPRFSVPVPVTVTDDGRVYGHAAQWGKCHLGFVGDCVTPPHEDTHPYFMTGEVVCADGSRVAVGQITVDTAHAPLYLGASTAQQHYDDTGCAVADVAVGNDQHGIWVAGAIRPDVEARRVRALRASGQLSGDWRRIGGALRLVGLLAVNTPGFPVPKMQAMVSSGQPLALVAAGHTTVGPRTESEDLVAARILRRMADELAARVTAVPGPVERQRIALAARVRGGR